MSESSKKRPTRRDFLKKAVTLTGVVPLTPQLFRAAPSGVAVSSAQAPQHRTNVVKAAHRSCPVQMVLYVGANHRSRSFGTKGNASSLTVRQGVHLFLDKLSCRADSTGKQLRPLQNGSPYFRKAVPGKDTPDRIFDALPQLHCAGQNVMCSLN